MPTQESLAQDKRELEEMEQKLTEEYDPVLEVKMLKKRKWVIVDSYVLAARRLGA